MNSLARIRLFKVTPDFYRVELFITNGSISSFRSEALLVKRMNLFAPHWRVEWVPGAEWLSLGDAIKCAWAHLQARDAQYRLTGEYVR